MMERTELMYLLITFIVSLMFIGSHIGPVVPVAFSLAVGSSMFPTINNGDMLICVSKYIAGIQSGDIAVYKDSGGFVVHRVLAIEGDYAVFKGDNNVLTDGKVPLSKVYFKVLFVLPSYVWVPLFAVTLSSYGVFLIVKRKKLEEVKEEVKAEKDVEVYSVSSIIYFVGISAIIILLAVNTLSTSPLYLVKPNPLPRISDFSSSGDIISVYFDTPLQNGNISCRGIINDKGIPLNCGKTGNLVRIDVSPLEKYCNEQKVCTIQIVILYKIDSPYDVEIQYPLSTTIRG